MTVIRHPDGTWEVVSPTGETLSVHATNADAWKWIERQSNSDWSMSACRHDWSFRTNARSGGSAA